MALVSAAFRIMVWENKLLIASFTTLTINIHQWY